MKYTSASVKQMKDRKGKPWRATIQYKVFDENGKAKWKQTTKMLPEAKGQREAKKMAIAWMDEMNRIADNTASVDLDKTVDVVVTKYLEYQLNSGELEKSTYTNTLYDYKKNVKPYLGDYNFATIDKTAINLWLTKLYNKGLSQNTIHTTFSRFKKVFNHYYETGELIKNPFQGVKTPKKGEAKVTHLTKEQMDEILNAVYLDYDAKDPMFAGILLAFYAGLRRGEIIGLRWRDIDFVRGTITVRSAVAIGGEGGAYTKPPKNKSSNRTFPMIPQLKDALQERYNVIKPKDHWFVCGDEEEFMAPTTFSHKFMEFRDNHNLEDAYGKKVVPHGLRHNLATVGIRSGMDIASLSLMMGHASRAMTLDTYGDANSDALQTASKKLGTTFRKDTTMEYSPEVEKELDSE